MWVTRKPRSLEDEIGAPITWIPITPRNPSKLTAHKFVKGKWVKLCYVKCVPWPEKFAEMAEVPKFKPRPMDWFSA
jgi:hypothetical protein